MIRLLFIFLLCSHASIAQKHDYNWVFGGRSDSTVNNCILKFSDTQPATAILSTGYVPIVHTNAAVSDSSGNLLFLTNGINVYNRNFQSIPGAIIQNNFTLSHANYGLNLPNTFIFLPFPGDTNLYILFYGIPETSISSGPCNGTWSSLGLANHLYYTVFDKNLNSGLGGVVSASNVAFTGLLSRSMGLSATKHANGRDWWIIVKNACDNGFQTFLLTPSGLTYSGQQFVTISFNTNKHALSSFSPDGSKYMMITSDYEVIFLLFDRCTGLFSNPLILPSYGGLFSFHSEFSANSRYLYRFVEQRQIVQYDLTDYLISGAVENSVQIVGNTDTFSCPILPVTTVNYLAAPRLGPDGKIYIGHAYFCDVLSTIESPDSTGIACTPQFHNFPIPALAGAVLSNNPNYRLGPLVGSVCDSLSVGLNQVNVADINIYPNPVGDFININLPIVANNIRLELFSADGRKVQKQNYSTVQSIKFYLAVEIVSGSYLLKISTKEFSVVKKVLVNR